MIKAFPSIVRNAQGTCFFLPYLNFFEFLSLTDNEAESMHLKYDVERDSKLMGNEEMDQK